MKRNQRTSKNSLYWHFLNVLPQNLVSRGAGALAYLRLPRPMMEWVIRRFAAIFRINMDEVLKPLQEFDSLQSFFIRELKEGARVIDQDELAIVSPCDGAYGQSGVIENGTLLQVKGRTYRLSELLCDQKWADALEGGTYATLYLSPKDYHRFHAPCDLHVAEGAHVPGRLWPVNLWAVRHVEELFCVNERVVMRAQSTRQTSEAFAIIAVGATMVGKVKLEFDETLTTNRPGGRYLRRGYAANQANYLKGKELGRFEFGSTLVVVYPKNAGTLDTRPPGTPVLLGQKIGMLNNVSK